MSRKVSHSDGQQAPARALPQFVRPLTEAEIRTKGDTSRCAQITRSDDTVAVYLQRAGQLISRMSRETGIAEPTLVDVVDWMLDRCTNKSPATIRLYRSAMRCYIEQQYQLGAISEEEFNALTAALAVMRSTRIVKEPNTSARKARSASLPIIRRLMNRLAGIKSKYAELAARLFVSTVITGLRPVEWPTATLEKDPSGGAVLTVVNAKATNGRSFGSTRRLYIPEADVPVIEGTINALQEALKTASWDKIYEGCRQVIRQAGVKTSKGQAVTLYTARHQFIANMKNIYSREEVALLAGHVSTETAAYHYGKRRSGHPAFKHAALVRLADEDEENRNEHHIRT